VIVRVYAVSIYVQSDISGADRIEANGFTAAAFGIFTVCSGAKAGTIVCIVIENGSNATIEVCIIGYSDYDIVVQPSVTIIMPLFDGIYIIALPQVYLYPLKSFTYSGQVVRSLVTVCYYRAVGYIRT
jgi:hypothetical protein